METPGSAGLEGDVEMVLAGQPARPLDFAKHAADHRAQRILHDLVVRESGFRGSRRSSPLVVAGGRSGQAESEYAVDATAAL